MKVVLMAVITMAATGSTFADAPSREAKPKATPVRLIAGETPENLRAIKLIGPAPAKAAPYIYKAPLATRPLKTW